MKNIFAKFSAKTSALMGSPTTFLVAVLIIGSWILSGKYFNFSNTWQLIINTGTTIITFLMVFLIQNTQNRDSMAIQLKLDELLTADKGARNSMVNIEELSDEELETIHQEFKNIQKKYNARLKPHGLEVKVE